MKQPEIEIDNKMLIEAIKKLTESLTEENTIKIEINANYKENRREFVIRVETKPSHGTSWTQQYFETGQKLKISFD